MTAWPDAATVLAFLRRASRRLTLLDAAQGAAGGLAAALVLELAGWPVRDAIGMSAVVGLVLAAAGVAVSVAIARTRRAPVSHLIERRAPACRNVVITADELIGRPSSSSLGTTEYVAALVCRDAARVFARSTLRRSFPAATRSPCSA